MMNHMKEKSSEEDKANNDLEQNIDLSISDGNASWIDSVRFFSEKNETHRIVFAAKCFFFLRHFTFIRSSMFLKNGELKKCFAFFLFSFSTFLAENKVLSYFYVKKGTAWKVSVFGVFLALIFVHLDCIRRDNEYVSVFSPNEGKYGPEYRHFLRSEFDICLQGIL